MRLRPLAQLFALLLAAGLACPDAARAQQTDGARPDSALEEYATIFASLARQALDDPRLAAPMPCLPHWLAGNDHVVVAVSGAGAAAGLEPGDILRRIGDRALTGRADGVWDAAIRALDEGLETYRVEVARHGTSLRLEVPCAAGEAAALHRAERAMWTAVTQRAWDECIDRGSEMIAALGADFSPPLMIMTRCAAAARRGDPALTSRLAHALLGELVAHPAPLPDLREQLLLTLRDLDAARQTGGPDYATPLRRRMAELGMDEGRPDISQENQR